MAGEKIQMLLYVYLYLQDMAVIHCRRRRLNFDVEDIFKPLPVGSFDNLKRLSEDTPAEPIDYDLTTKPMTKTRTTIHDTATKPTNYTLGAIIQKRKLQEVEYILQESSGIMNELQVQADLIARVSQHISELPTNDSQEYRRNYDKRGFGRPVQLLLDYDKNYYVLRSTMLNYVMRTKFELVFVQKTKKMYDRKTKFKIGFCFALLNLLKGQMRKLYHIFDYRPLNSDDLYFHLNIFEKLGRLGVDIKDLIAYVRELEIKRKEEDHLKRTKKPLRTDKKKYINYFPQY